MIKRIARIGDEAGERVLVPPAFWSASELAALTDAGLVGGEVQVLTSLGEHPLMTAADAPAPCQVLDSGNWTAGAEPWRAVRPVAAASGRAYISTTGIIGAGGVLTSPVWFTAVAPARRMVRYDLTPSLSGRAPVSWTLEGANDAAGPWTVVDARSDLTSGWSSANPRSFTVANPASFTHYRFNFTKAIFNGEYIDLNKVAMLWDRFGYTATSRAFVVLASPRYAAAYLRVRAAAIQTDKTGVKLSRDGATFTPARLKRLRTLSDGSHVYLALADLGAQPAGTMLQALFETRQPEIVLCGWTITPVAKGGNP